MELLDYVRMFEGKSDSERRKILIDILDKEGFNHKAESYDSIFRNGINIIVEKGQGKEILATTHYDVVPGSPGANDNASSIAVLLDVLHRLRDYKPKNKIKIIFFDQEEPQINGAYLIGSHAYVKEHGVEDLLGVYNLELCGMGDMVGIWPVTQEVEGNYALENLRETLKRSNVYYEEAAKLPFFDGDHRSFREAGFPGAVCISILPYKDRKKIRKFAEGRGFLFPLLFRLDPRIPKMFRLYHSSEDKSEYLNESAMKLAADVVFNAVVSLDVKVK